jgi:acyl-CoA reductase-like NAD-dependent aldehyde dehydrogenase
MRIYKEEIFGPVLSVVRAKDYAEALRLPTEHECIVKPRPSTASVAPSWSPIST